MNMLIYLLKSGACLAIFMAFYTFFLEKENMHVFKRYYLLGALIIAFGIPLVTFTHYVEVTPMPIIDAPVTSVVYYTEEIPLTQESNYLPIILWSIYGVGALLFGAKFLMNLLQIIFRIHRNPKQKSKHIVYVLLSDLITPHTFFKYIFLNKQKFEKQEILQEVFWHEETHARQKHSIDVLFVELLQVIFWFNPLIYFVKHSIKMNHEFLADQAVLNRGISTSNYQHILLAFSSDAAESQLANAINYSSTRHAIGMIKKRFTVMKTHTSKRNIWLRSALLLPLLALTLYGFSEKKEVIKPISNQTFSSDTIQDVLIYIDESNTLSLNGNPVKFEDLETEINKLNPHLTSEQKRIFLDATIQYEKTESMDLIKTIQSILVKCDIFSNGTSYINTLKKSGLSTKLSKNKYAGKTTEEANAIFDKETIDLSPPKPIDPNSPWQIGFEVSTISYEETGEEPLIVTSKMLEEYNTIAKSINSQSEATRTAKLKDFNRISEIHSYMSDEQKRLSEPLPKLGYYEIQSKATPEEIKEYNKLAKHYNSQYPDKMVIKMKDMRRLRELHDKMTTEQIASVEPMPNFPPPPPPTQKDGTRNAAFANKTTPPPPPPMPPNPTEEQKRGYEKAMEAYKIQRESYTYKHTNTNGKVVDVIIIPENDGMVQPPSPPSIKKQSKEDPLKEKVVIGYGVKNSSKTKEQTQFTIKNPNEPITVVGYEIKEKPENYKKGVPLPPRPPISPLEHIIEMSKKGALFFYNDKTISADEAIKYIKNNKDLSISTKQLDTDQPKVYISTEPIKVENKNNSKELVMINGKKPINHVITISRAELMDATLSIKDGTVISFKLKIPGKPTQSITGNTMNTETKALIKEAFEKDAIQIFMIKNSNNQAHPPIKISIKE